MEIVSGKTGTPHVTSTQFRQMLEGSIGQGSYILSSGNNIEPELVSNNQLKIKSGMICHHGCISAVQLGTYDTITLDNGSQGKKRIDLVVNRYTKNSSTGIEACNWVVIKGAESSTTAVAPSATVGNLQDGDLIDDCAVFEVHYNGINVTEVKKLLSVIKNAGDIEKEIANLSKLSGCGQRCEYGKYGTRWQLTNNYGNIGSTLPAVDNELFKTVSGSNACAYVKKSGMYLLNFNGNYEGESVIWMQLAIDQATEYEYTVSCTRYTSLNFSRVVHLNAGQKITVNVSGSSGYTAFSTGKELMQVMCLSLD